MDVRSTLITVLSVFPLLLVGYGAKKAGILKANHAQVINSLVINLTLPAFIFVNAHDKPLTSAMVKVPGVAIAAELVVMCAAYLVARLLKLDRPTTGGFMLVAAFGNTGYLGYPLVKAAFHGDPNAMLTAVLFDGFGMRTALATIGIVVAASFAGSKFERKSLLEFIKTPLVPMTILALILRKVYVPPAVLSVLTFVGNWTVPLAMLSTGLSLEAGALRSYPLPLAAAAALKMGLMPLLMYLALPHAGIHGVVYRVAILESVVPSAVFSSVIAARYKANGEFAAAAVFLSTFISIAWIPAVLIMVR